MSKRYYLLDGWFDGLRPVVRITVDEWSDLNVKLTTENSAEPGRYRTDRFPFLRDIFRDLSPMSLILDVTAMKGVQVGFTTAALNVAGCFIDLDPCPIMYLMPTVDNAKVISKTRFTPMVDNSDSLSQKIKPARGRDSGNTLLMKEYPGGSISFSGANSAAALRSRPIRILLVDELDAFPMDVDGEGSPLSLAEKRQSTFGSKKKIFKLSTPTTKGLSRIELELELTDYRKYFVPCPECGAFQHLEFERIVWEEGKPETARYECAHCKEPIHERHKTRMLADGVWTPTKPENIHPTRRGYHINSLYSPLGMLSWADIVDQYLKAIADETGSLMKTFVNSIKGESYEEAGDAPEWERLYNMRLQYQPGEVPVNEAALLTAGVDVQADRLEVEVVAWCEGKRTYSVDYRVLVGDTASASNKVWKDLAAMLDVPYRRPDGVEMPIKIMAVDSGYNTAAVYDFCYTYASRGVIAVDGQEAQKSIVATPKAVQVSRSGKKIGSALLYSVGVSILKSEIYGWLKLPLNEDGSQPDGYCSFPNYDARYFKMLTAEKFTLSKDKKGFFKYAWILPSHARNEALDCRNYARAAATVAGMDRYTSEDWNTMRNSYAPAPPPPERKRRGGNFLEGGSIWDR